MLTSKKGKQLSSSFSIENFMLGCLEDKYSLNLSAWSGEENSTNVHRYNAYRYNVSVETLEELK